MSGNNIYILPDNCPSCSPSFKPKRQHQDAIEEWRLRTCGGIATRVVGQIASARNWQALSGAGRLSIRSLMAPWFAIETNDEARYGLDAPVHRNRWSRGMAGPPRLSRRVISQARPAPRPGAVRFAEQLLGWWRPMAWCSSTRYCLPSAARHRIEAIGAAPKSAMVY